MNSFREELKEYLNREDFLSIYGPNFRRIDAENEIKRENQNIIARLDGCDNYKCNLTTLINLAFKQQLELPYKYSKLDNIAIFPKSSLILNKYLSRKELKLIKRCKAIIFQSEISKRMYSKLLKIEFDKTPNFIIHNGTKYKKHDLNNNIDRSVYGYPSVVVSASRYRTQKR